MKVSFVIPVLNSEKTLGECLAAIRAQDVPPGVACEIVIADAGSSDRTLEIARAAGVDAIVPNPLKTGEAGKTAGIKAANGDVIALVDSDNILPDADWLRRMTAPFADPEVVAAEPIAYTVRPQDPAPTRYFALLGMNDPICLFTRNYDRVCGVTGRWTGLAVHEEDCGDWLKLRLRRDALPTIGANGFMFRRALLDGTNWDPYLFDIDILYERICRDGEVCVAKVKTGIVHLYCARLSDFARKQRRRIRDFLYFAEAKQRSYPWNRQRKAGIVLFCLSTVTVVPLLAQMLAGWFRKPDRAWLYHVPVCAVTLWIYGCGALAKLFGRKQAIADRSAWQKT
ncbi:MAG: glycosyltransferase family 2 protein [Kiritimatiellae bacterium]|nr:glycosyltransferase family 2 protein [Kiritimatiellia bacterium]